MPPQDGIRGDQQTQSAQRRARQRHEKRGEECPVLGPQLCALITELSLQDVDLMAQRQDLDVLLAVGHRQQPQRGESVGDSEVGETEQHEP